MDGQGHRTAYHLLRQFLHGGIGSDDRAHGFTLAQDSHPIGDVQHLLQFVGDDDHSMTFPPHLPQDGEELLRFLRGQHGGRLVQNQNVCAPGKHLQNFHRLLFAHGHVVNLLVQVALQPEKLLQGLRGLRQLAAGTQENIFPGSHHVHQLKVLVNHANAQVNGLLGAADGHAFSVDINLSAVRLINAAERIHQRGFAAAVFPQQGENLPPADGQVHVMVGLHRAEGLAQPLQPDGV